MCRVLQIILFCCVPVFLIGQTKQGLVAGYSFNDGTAIDEISGDAAKARNVTLTEDRFGNSASAYYFHGILGSYLNLGSADRLKPKTGTISLWININGLMGLGKGVDSNPFLLTRSHEVDECNQAYYLGVDLNTRKVNGSITTDCMNGITLYSPNEVDLSKWYHIALSFDDRTIALYLDGALQYKTEKRFQNKYLKDDSVMVGNMIGKKNVRFFLGCIDDIMFYDRMLSEDEIKDLFNAPNPNKLKVLMGWIGKALLVLLFIGLIIVVIRRRIKVLLKREEEKNQLKSHWYEQENRVLSAQMDPHFIFNSLNTIQQFIIVNDNEKAQLYLSKFSKLIRQILENNTKSNITLEEEIDTVKKYLEIEALRFNNVFDYSISLKEITEPEKIRIPHFLIQPLIENAIWHGLLPKSGPKLLNIIFERPDQKTLVCSVDDNGVGRKTSKPGTIKKRKSLALNFIRQRLQLLSKMHGGNYEINIIDKLNNHGESDGTKVTINIPILND